MEPASDHSYHPSSDASLRSIFHGAGTPAAQRSRSRGRRCFGEVKSPSIVSPPSQDFGSSRDAPHNKRSGGNYNNGNIASNNKNGDSPKSLQQHISSRNFRARKPYEMDVESYDKDQPTWASQDWCTEARKSRAALRGAPEDGTQVDDFSCLWNKAVNDADDHHIQVDNSIRKAPSSGGRLPDQQYYHQNGRDLRSYGTLQTDRRDGSQYYNQNVDNNNNHRGRIQRMDDRERAGHGEGSAPLDWHDGTGRSRNGDLIARVMGMEDPTAEAWNETRPKSRNSVHRRHSRLHQQQQQHQRPSRSHSHGPVDSAQRTARPITLGDSSPPPPPGAPSQRQRTRSRSRPAKKLGCLGGSSDMTRRHGISTGLHNHNTSGMTKENVETFEHEMRSGGKPIQTERSSASSSRGRPSRSQSRGPEQRDHSSRHGQRGVSRDPSRSRSQSRPRKDSSNHLAQRDKSLPRGQSSQPSRSLSRGRGSQSQRNLRSSSENHRNDNLQRNDNEATTYGSRSTKNSRSNSLKKSMKKSPGNTTVASSYSSSTFSTPSTGPLSSFSGKSSKGSLLRSTSKRLPPSTPPQLDDDCSRHSRPATPNRVPSINGGDDSTVNTSGHDSGLGKDDEQILTNMFDRKGYCVRHPNVRLRKKKILGGWNVLLANCPDCCVEEMGRLKRARRKMKERGERKSGRASATAKKKKSEAPARRPEDSQGRRSRSRSRARKMQGTTEAKSAHNAKSSHRSKGLDWRSSSRGRHRENAPPVFEFAVPLDEQGDITHPRSTRSLRSRNSHKSSSSKKSSKSTRTNVSARTKSSGKSVRTNRSSKDNGGVGETVVSRGSHPGSAQRFIHQTNGRERRLRVAKMPFTDKYGREGKYTGEINEYGQPHGVGTLRYNNGTVYEGIWEEGSSEDMDNNLGRAKESGFSGNWKNDTKAARAKREKRKEQDMHDLHSFISQSVRSSMSDASGSQMRSQYDNSRKNNHQSLSSSQQRQGRHRGQESQGEVREMPWSDVNGFSGHYTGEVDSQNVPDGKGFMRYSNGVVEQGLFLNGVFHTPADPSPRPSFDGDGIGGNAGAVPSSSMSVWSLKSSPTMAFSQGGHNVVTGKHLGVGGSMSGIMGAPTSVHLGGPGMYGNSDHFH